MIAGSLADACMLSYQIQVGNSHRLRTVELDTLLQCTHSQINLCCFLTPPRSFWSFLNARFRICRLWLIEIEPGTASMRLALVSQMHFLAD